LIPLDYFVDDDLLYSPFISLNWPTLYPPPLVISDTIYQFTATFSAALAPPLVAAADQIYAPTVFSKVLGPPLVVDNDVFGGIKDIKQGKATINQTFPLDSVYSDDLFYSPVIQTTTRAVVTRQAAVPTSVGIAFVSESTSYAMALPGE